MSGHLGMILATCFDESGGRLYSVSDKGAVNVWDVDRAERVDSFPGRLGPINDLKYADGTLFLAGFDRSVTVLDATSGTEAMVLKGHDAGVHTVAVTAGLIASGSADGRIGLWKRPSGEHVAWLSGHRDAVTCVAFLSDSRLISGSRDTTLRVWDLDTQREAARLDGHDYWVTKVAALDERRAVSIGEDGTLRVWDCHTGVQTMTVTATDVAWGLGVNEARTFAIMSGSDTLRVDLTDGSHGRLDGVRTSRGISISPCGNIAALGNDDSDIALYDLEQNRVVSLLEGGGIGVMSAFCGKENTVVGLTNGNVEVHVAQNRRVIANAHRAPVYAVRMIDTERFITGGFDGAVRIRRLDTLESIAEFDHGSFIFSLALPETRATLLCAGGGVIRLWDVTTGRQIWHEDGLGGHVMGAIDSEGSLIAAADTHLHVWQAGEWVKTTMELTGEMVSSIEFFPGSHRAAIGFATGLVGTVDAAGGGFTELHNEHEDWLRTLRVSPDGTQVLSVSQNGVARVYDLERGCILSRISETPVRAADFGEDNRICWVDARGPCHSA